MTDHPAPTGDLPKLAFRVASLSARKPSRFNLVPTAAERAAMAAELDLLDLPAFALKGEIRPAGKADFALEAQMEARVVQPCSVTLQPVTTTISEPVARHYIKDYTPPEGDEVEIPEDDSLDALPDVIDVTAVALEALALALPLYPRAPGATLGEAVFAEPGTAPLKDEDLRPFAGLADLKARLEGGPGQGEGDTAKAAGKPDKSGA